MSSLVQAQQALQDARRRTLQGETVPTSAPQPPESIVHNIIFWRNGFTVNDGPLRRLDDPENASFLESITKSECPRSWLTYPNAWGPRSRRNGRIPFQGVGRTLGSSSTPAASEPSSSAPTSTGPAASSVLDESHCHQPRFKSDWQMELAWLHTLISAKLLVTSVPLLMLQGQVTPGPINCKQLDFLLKYSGTQPKQLRKQDWGIQWLFKSSDELLPKRFLFSCVFLQ
ncbi:Plant UBX domain-containing protein 3 [Datura stramonium]|uniref:Plant UBX domain-containing protein 3 n=1 Tax=Datura stramonium TaxID=4076 RepID=A0ABS8WMZ4_DATST|nr:Plant UBX domain-containing protein 3 [Datura stramonium]